MIRFEILPPDKLHVGGLHLTFSCVLHLSSSFSILIRLIEKSIYFTQVLSAFSVSPRTLISTFMFLQVYFFLLSLSLSQLYICQKPYLPTVWEKKKKKKKWFLLNSALWNERKHCINEAEELIHLCLYYCEINYAGLFRKLLIVANWMASISA